MTNRDYEKRIETHEAEAFRALDEASYGGHGNGEFGRQNRAAYASLAVAHFEAVKLLEKRRHEAAQKEFFDSIYIHNPKSADE